MSYRYPEFSQNQESGYLGLTARILAETAEGVWQKKKDAGNSVSKPVALGLVMKNEGRDILKSILSSTSNFNIAPDINSVLNDLNESNRRKFRYGFGEVILGSTLEALEKGIFEWDDEVFVSNFNEAIMGTPLSQVELADIKAVLKRQQDRGGQRLRTAQEQTQIIKGSLKEGKEKRFLNFLESSSFQPDLLPQTIYAFIYGIQPLAGRALSEVLPVYKEALTHLKPILSPTGSYF